MEQPNYVKIKKFYRTERISMHALHHTTEYNQHCSQYIQNSTTEKLLVQSGTNTMKMKLCWLIEKSQKYQVEEKTNCTSGCIRTSNNRNAHNLKKKNAHLDISISVVINENPP